jgi:endonuclease/exonuclease/phosphatase (EEP) superfamily protein YafD
MATWPLLAPSAIVALARLTRRERRFTVLAAESISDLLALPTLVGLSMGVASRRRDLTAVAGGLALAHLLWALPQLRRPRGAPDDGGGAAVRLLSFNLLFVNLDMGAVAAELRKADADVLLLQEMSRANLELLEKEEVLDAYPHRLVDARPDALGSAIYSRLPLDDAEIWRTSGFPMARATVLVDDRRLRVYDVHTRAPFGPGAYEHWIRQLQGLGDAAASEPHPVVMAGDYNATWGHRPFRELMGRGLRDAFVERRRWWTTTWPCDSRMLPPFARIDHVLVSADVAVRGVLVGAAAGSDHRPVIADLAVLR